MAVHALLEELTGYSSSASPSSSHSRQTHSCARGERALSSAGTIVTPQLGQIGGRSPSVPEVWIGAV